MSDSFIKKSGVLTKRERFAMHAMSAYMSGNFAYSGDGGGSVFPYPEEAAEEAVKYADALIEELEKTENK